MQLEDFGYNDQLEKSRVDMRLTEFDLGRVIAEHKERYVVITTQGELDAEITGNMRFTAKSREDFPAVGDWVALIPYESGIAIIHAILPRFSIIKRQAVGIQGESQVIATNIDYALIIQAVDRDFNINRLERYLTICYSSNVRPVIILSKVDLLDQGQVNYLLNRIQSRIKDVPVIGLSNQTQTGYNDLKQLIEKGKTYCLLGSSGVGKSTLLNNLSGKTLMKTESISIGTNRGRHITTHRELIRLDSGGLLIDNPGMREVGITNTTGGLEMTFDQIERFAEQCRFTDCSHTNELGCNVLDALEKGKLERAVYDNYMKMQREKAHYESTVFEKHKKEKVFGKLMKNYKKDMKKNPD